MLIRRCSCYHQVFREFRKLGNVTAAVETSMDALLLPIFLTSITTIAAFLTW
ncbi:hypothetical protein Ct9H90mP29_10750 [bacterium]|nr:MAG: hypothetical protein Ct9H90mP29_10750 [bacterium]